MCGVFVYGEIYKSDPADMRGLESVVGVLNLFDL